MMMMLVLAAWGAGVAGQTLSANPALLWSAVPLSQAMIEKNDAWMDVPDTVVKFELVNEASVMISYEAVVSPILQVRDSATLLVNESEIGFRVMVDGVAYRQSGTSIGTNDPLMSTVSGYLGMELLAGPHEARLQWRKRGNRVSAWVISSAVLDGYAGGRSLVVSAEHRYLWYTQPLSVASINSADRWEMVPDMSLQFTLTDVTNIRIFYQFPVRPELVAYIRETNMKDEIESVVQLNGLNFRETGYYGIIDGSSKSPVIMQGSAITTLKPGSYSIALYWKRLKTSQRTWFSYPSALDGFSMGRVLGVVGEYEMDYVSVYNLDQYRKTAVVGDWSDVGDSMLQFMLPKATQVMLSYNLPVSQRDNPIFIGWDDSIWQRIETRLLLDGVAYRHVSSYVDGSVRGIKNARASMVLPLPAGSHTVRLQWKNVDGNRWTAVSFVTDHASSYASVFVYVNTWNNDPVITAASRYYGSEDNDMLIPGVQIIDSNAQMALNYAVTISLTVQHGVLTTEPTAGITYASGNGVKNAYMLFSGALSDVNALLKTLQYRAFLNWYGNDTLTIVVTDQASTGYTTVSTDRKVVTLSIASVNDLPQLVVPSTQYVAEDDELSIFGVSLNDVDVISNMDDATFELTMYAISGVLSLVTADNLEFLEGDGDHDQFIRARGRMVDVAAALFEIMYKPDRDYNSMHHAEQIGIRVKDFNWRDNTVTEVSAALPVIVQPVDDPAVMWLTEKYALSLRGLDVQVAGGTGAENLFVSMQTMTNQAVALSTTQLLCTTPQYWFEYWRQPRAPVPFQVQDNAVRSKESVMFTFVAPSIVYSIIPTVGASTGGTVVTIKGTNFYRGYSAACLFSESVRVQAVVIDTETITCMAPALVLGMHSLIVMLNGWDRVETNVQYFLSIPQHHVLSIDPPRGMSSPAEDTVVVVRGLNFTYSRDLRCRFDDVVTGAVFLLSTAIRCHVPFMPAGVKNVSIAINGKDFAPAAPYTVVPRMSIAAIKPTQGHEGTIVSLSGVFANDTSLQCVLGDTPVPANFINRSSVQCVVPFSGLLTTKIAVNVKVFKSIAVVENANILTYSPFPSARQQFKGSNLSKNAANCESGDSGKYIIQMGPSASFIQRHNSTMKIEIIPTVEILKLAPSYGIIDGNAVVQILGNGFVATESLACRFDTSVVAATFVNSSTIECRTPPSRPGRAMVQLSLDGLSFLPQRLELTYLQPFVVRDATVQISPSQSNASVIVVAVDSNEHLQQGARFVCKIQKSGTTYENSSWGMQWTVLSAQVDLLRQSIRCVVPNDSPSGLWSLQVLNVDASIESNVVSVDVVSAAVISNVQPGFGSVTGGYTIQIHGANFPALAFIVCDFNGVHTTATLTSRQLLSCVTPPVSKPTQVQAAIKAGSQNLTTIATFAFTYVPAPFIYEINPLVGWSDGATTVFVRAHRISFAPTVACEFGGRLVSAERIVKDQISCQLPSGLSPGNVSLAVSTDGAPWSQIQNYSFQILPFPTVLRISPSAVTLDMPTALHVTGSFQGLTHVSNNVFCTFDQALVTPARFINSTVLECNTTAGLKPGVVVVGLSYDTVHSATLSQIVVQNKPSFDTLWPQVVSESSQQLTISLKGSGFVVTPNGQCRFAASNITRRIDYANATEVRCSLPRLRPGSEPVEVSWDGSTFTSTGLQLSVKKQPTVLTMEPRVDTFEGGSLVTFTGINLFFAPSLSCMFDQKQVPAGMANDSLTCVTPSVPVGLNDSQAFSSVNVSLVMHGQPYTPSTFEFTFVNRITLSAVEVITRNSIRLVRGCGDFGAIPLSYFKLVESDASDRDPQQYVMQARVDPDAPGCHVAQLPQAADCRLSCQFAVSVNNQSYFEYPETITAGFPLRISSVWPPVLTSTGKNEEIQIQGSHFAAVSKFYCIFGANQTILAKRMSDTTLVCVTPATLPKVTTLKVSISSASNPAVESNNVTVTFVGPMEISQIKPKQGFSSGGTTVTISGKGFVPHRYLRCRFGDNGWTTALVMDTTSITCAVPVRRSQQKAVAVSVVLGSVGATSEQVFQYIDFPAVDHITPTHGIYDTTHNISIIGNFTFPSNTVVLCRVGEAGDPQVALLVNSTTLTCPAQYLNQHGHSNASGAAMVSLSVDGQRFLNTGISFTFVWPVSVLNVQPSIVMTTRPSTLVFTTSKLQWQAGLSCLFVELNVTTPAQMQSETEVHCPFGPFSLPLLLGPVSVMLFSNNQPFSFPKTLQIVPTPVMQDIQPRSGPTYRVLLEDDNDSRMVAVIGSHFPAFTTVLCRFGSQVTGGMFMNSTQVQCRVPTFPLPLRVPVAVAFNGVDFIPLPMPYEYVDDFRIDRLSPDIGATSGNTTVHISGGVFLPSERIRCVFGDVEAFEDAQVITSTEVVCRTPPYLQAVTVAVRVVSITRNIQGHLAGAFRYTVPPEVLIVTPKSAFEKSATLFDIYGVGFVHSKWLRCCFDSTNSSHNCVAGSDDSAWSRHAVWVSSTHIKCYSPPTNDSTGAMTVGITNNGLDYVYAPPTQAITFVTQFDITDVYPAFGPIDGGTAVEIQGKRFSSSLSVWCRFGDGSQAVSARILSDNKVLCFSPPLVYSLSDPGVDMPLLLSVNKKDFVATGHWFQYTEKWHVLSVSPTIGSMEGSTLLTISGRNFIVDAPAWCMIGTEVVKAVVATESMLQCVAPGDIYAEDVVVEVSMNDGVDYSSNGVLFTYVRAPRIRLVTPLSGPASGNTLLRVWGMNFYGTQAVRCCFGDQFHCTRAVRLSDFELRCKTPLTPVLASSAASATLKVPLLISFNGQDMYKFTKPFEFVYDAIVTGIEPTIGDVRGGTSVIILGRHFRPSSKLSCRFGPKVKTATFLNETAIQCIAPAQPANIVAVVISMNGKDYTQTNVSFQYIDLPIVYRVEPASVPVNTNVSVRVIGTGFTMGRTTSCHFVIGNVEVAATDAYVETNSSVLCSVPVVTRSSIASVFVSVDGIAARLRQQVPLALVDQVSVHSIFPRLGPHTGGTQVQVFGNRFFRAETLECCFSQNPSASANCTTAVFVSEDKVNCSTPSRALRVGPANVSVRVDGVPVSDGMIEFDAIFPLHVYDIIPKYGSHRGGTKVVVTGDGFQQTPQLSCCFGRRLIRATFVNSSNLECTTPLDMGTKVVDVRISNNGRDCENAAAQAQTFQFTEPAIMVSLTPASGSIYGGTVVSVTGANFIANITNCYVGGIASFNCSVVSNTEMTCVVPPMQSTGDQLVTVSNNAVDQSPSAVYFSYRDAEQVISIAPERSAARGGATISVMTKNVLDTPELSCFFNATRVPAVFDSANRVFCDVPPAAPSLLRVFVSVDGVSKSMSFAEHVLVSPPVILSVMPLAGFVTGGELVVIQGSHLQYVTHCRFGARLAIAYVSSPSHAQCIAPPQADAGSVAFQLMDNGAILPTDAMEFVYLSAVNLTGDALLPSRYLLNKQEAAGLEADPVDPSQVPSIKSINPRTATTDGASVITVTGYNFQNVLELACRFGDLVVRARFMTSTEVKCSVPRMVPGTYVLQVSNDGVEFSNDPIQLDLYLDAYVHSIAPTQGPWTGGTRITLYGRHFSQTTAASCVFGEKIRVPVAQFVSSTEIVCVVPPQDDSSSVVQVVVMNNNATYTSNPVFFRYTGTADVVSVVPSFGTASGGTPILLKAYNVDINMNNRIVCRFGDVDVEGEVVDSFLARCVTPPHAPGDVAVQLSTNDGFDFVNAQTRFTFGEPARVAMISPALGPSVDAFTVVTVYGSGFINTAALACLFDDIKTPATWRSPTMLTCSTPRHAPGDVLVRITNNGLDRSEAFATFQYYMDPAVARIAPVQGLMEGGNPVFVQGRNFLNQSLLACRFGEELVRATYISPSLLSCVSPRQLHNLLPVNGKLSFEVTNNHVDFTKSGLLFGYLQSCPEQQHCMNGNIMRSPNGTISSSRSAMNGNFTLCAPGTFQPRESARLCLPCPVGFFCPDFGMSKPILCPAGKVCDTHGLRTPIKPCPSGHYCRKGTKTLDPRDFIDNAQYTTDSETQLVSFVPSTKSWAYINRSAPAIGSRRIEHPPNETSCDLRLCDERDNVTLLAERPYTCPVGTFCRRGVIQQQLVDQNFSTPQKCFQGFFCPRGSSTPEGQGPCPTGHYCPTDTDAIGCPPGKYCPGVGNIHPKDCYPGTYNPYPRQSNCTLCPTGHVCPSWHMTAPVLCPAGFVCISTGLSAPVLLCPPGYYCPEGTRTLDTSDIEPNRPQPCAQGTYCLGGVAHNRTIRWLPTQPEGAVAPQECNEGTYCTEATMTQSGTGMCFAGHYCPPGSAYPTQAPQGSFAGSKGSVAATLCFPGTYTPLKGTTKCEVCPAGYSCPGYGTYIPSICPRGYYRSLADSVTCRPCPEGTWSDHTGVTDISLCEICPAGRVCGSSAMYNLSMSLPCASGYVCGEGTNRRAQFSHVCPAGHYCYSATTIQDQYTSVCQAGNICLRGTTDQAKSKNKCPDGKFCPTGTANMTSIYIQCPSATWTKTGQDELLDCAIRATPICDKAKQPDKQYYPKFSYNFQGKTISFDSTVDSADRTGEVEVVDIIYPVNESASVSFWKNDTVDTIRACPTTGSIDGGMLLTVIGRNFQNTNRLVCSFQISDDSLSVQSPAFYISDTRVQCRTPKFTTGISDPNFYQDVWVRISNYGVHYSTTAATFRFISSQEFFKQNITTATTACLARNENEEGFRSDDKAWFAMRGFGKAKLTFDFRHIPPEMVYNEHYRIALFVKNSTCEYQSCDSRGVVKASGADIETVPCKLPINFPEWFESPTVDKHDVLNLTVFALEDVLFKIEVHILYGMYASTAPFFVNTTVVQIKTPVRANTTQGVDADLRPLSRTISYEGALAPRDYTFLTVYFSSDGDQTSPPLNLPPKFKQFERGRVLISHNVSSSSPQVPLMLDPIDNVRPDTSYWLMPYGSAELTHQMVEKYRETFHEMYPDPQDPTGTQYQFKFEKIVLPYLPFFSNCMEYDSYIPLFDLFESQQCNLPDVTSDTEQYSRHWWRRQFPPLPNQDDVRHVGPTDVLQQPTADWCMFDTKCNYEEDLPNADVNPRWFEQQQDTILFHILREPATLANYVRGGAYYDEIMVDVGSDYFIPVTVDNSDASNVVGGCSTLCFPRQVTLDVAYYQISDNLKRIIKTTLILSNYDLDATNTNYTLSVNFHALDYLNLIVQFAFERQVFITLFVVIGSFLTSIAAVFWITVRLTTFLETPPRFRFWSLFSLIAPQPAVGVVLGSAPIFVVVAGFYVLLNGDRWFSMRSAAGYWMLDNVIKHYVDEKIDPNEVENTRTGRLGFSFFVLSLYLIYLGAHIFLPKSIAISEKLILEKQDSEAKERSVWWPTQWKRANMMFASIVLGVFLVFLVEFSFWSSFGNYIFYIIILLMGVCMFIEGLIESAVKEKLLMAPLVSALSLVSGVITIGASDFRDFLLGNTQDFGQSIVEKVYLDTAIEAATEFVKMCVMFLFTKLKAVVKTFVALFRTFTRSQVRAETEEKKEKKEEEEEAETVEPIIDFFSGVSMDRLAMFYQPILIILMIVFRKEMVIPILYNIREKDMEFYLWYSIIILGFQLVSEVFILNVIELFHGWKLYDYLVYSRYRFLQREKRWKGFEPNLDECIEESLRTLDQMCFSSQFFMMCTIHITGIVFFVVALEIIVRAKHNFFGDPASLILGAFVVTLAVFVRRFVLFLAVKFEFWKIKHENTAWLAPPEDDDEFGVPQWDELEKIKGASHDAYLMNQRITSDTFRYKFLNYNRSWIVQQLPNVLTPRTLRRARPYLLAQFSKILDSLNPQISEDDEDDDGRPRFGPVTLSAPSRTIIRLWLARARRIQRLRSVVQPIIQAARKTECEMCLSRRQLNVELAIPIEVLGDKFESQSLAEEFDVAGWKEFFVKHEKFKTLCLNCIVHLRSQAVNPRSLFGDGGNDFAGDSGWGQIQLNAASYALMQKWYRKAQDRVFGKNGKRRAMVDVSDDEEEVMTRNFDWTKKPLMLNAASTAIARKWVALARQSLRESGRARTTLPETLGMTPGIRGATPIQRPPMKMGATGGAIDRTSNMRRK
ncbi:TPA: hypothetical protein N0F65_006795 [Lagenidium giganteum]|uniref:IPT/TIG domain-containing protein n=1 Tax=Lagenidium giganteum TaxID=4803 RepID=A0AAV2ZBC7_9STRA|nr:TPA: hypothetical protein N0F65_006795 [Lagenidium giganteum]